MAREVTRSQVKSEAMSSLSGRCFGLAKSWTALRDDDGVTEENRCILFYVNTVEVTNE